MKILKLTAIVLLSILIVSTTGCVSVTSSPDVEASYHKDESAITSKHKYFKAIEVGKTEGFKGTNAFWFSGKVSPNLNNETAKEALEKSLESSNMLAKDSDKAEYKLDATMVEDGAKGVMALGTSLNGMSRDMKIQYVLTTIGSNIELYNEIISSHGEADCSDACFAYYVQESYAAERSNVDSHKQLIEDLKALPSD